MLQHVLVHIFFQPIGLSLCAVGKLISLLIIINNYCVHTNRDHVLKIASFCENVWKRLLEIKIADGGWSDPRLKKASELLIGLRLLLLSLLSDSGTAPPTLWVGQRWTPPKVDPLLPSSNICIVVVVELQRKETRLVRARTNLNQ